MADIKKNYQHTRNTPLGLTKKYHQCWDEENGGPCCDNTDDAREKQSINESSTKVKHGLYGVTEGKFKGMTFALGQIIEGQLQGEVIPRMIVFRDDDQVLCKKQNVGAMGVGLRDLQVVNQSRKSTVAANIDRPNTKHLCPMIYIALDIFEEITDLSIGFEGERATYEQVRSPAMVARATSMTMTT
jgi:hypothetical protein